MFYLIFISVLHNFIIIALILESIADILIQLN